ncbi:MAG TPA: glycosyltransferase [Phycisphaerae bacterium]|nr:glycosyltransferase [Phycisphaerae bacterium]
MRLGVQILSLRPGQVGGQEVLVRRLFRRMLPMADDDRIVVFHRPELADEAEWRPVLGDPKVESVPGRPEEHYGDGYAGWALKIMRDAGVDAAFFPLFFFFPRPLPIPVVVHIPDLQHEFYPEYFPPDQLAWRRERIPESVAMADAVVTCSEFSAATMREKLNADPARLHVIRAGGFLQEEMNATDSFVPGVSPRTHSPFPNLCGTGFQPVGLQGFGIGSKERAIDVSGDVPFVFYPAADWPHKNHETLLRAMALLARRGRPERLALTGMFSQHGDALKTLANNLGIADRVHFLGCVEQAVLIGLYRRAKVMAFPSRFEGFGLPLVEAMQLGCPIVASRAEAVIETAGEAALFCDDSPESWAAALARVLDSPDVQTDLRRRGAVRAADFGWGAAAERFLGLFRSLAVKRS